jgi:hypothetical protein
VKQKPHDVNHLANRQEVLGFGAWDDIPMSVSTNPGQTTMMQSGGASSPLNSMRWRT